MKQTTSTMRALLVVSLLVALPAAAAADETFWVRSRDSRLAVTPSSIGPIGGVQIVAQYGDALLVRVSSGPARAALSQRFEIAPLPNATGIGHWKGIFDPLTTTRGRALAAAAAEKAAAGPALHLVQFIGPPQDGWLTEVRELGAELVTYFPQSSYLARLDGKQRAAIARLSFVRWIGAWDADLKFDPETDTIRNADPSTEVVVNVAIFNPGRDPRATDVEKGVIRQSGGSVLQEALSGNHEIVRVRTRAGALNGIAQNPNVIGVEAYHEPKLDDESTSLSVAGHYSGEIGISPPSPTYASWLSTLGFNGSTVTVGVVDDGVDTTEVHLSGRVTNILSGASAGAAGHGHHVAGIVAGACTHTADALGYRFGAGVAPGASILNQPFLDSTKPGTWSNGCGTATDYGCLTQQTVSTAGTNGTYGYVQNNSWGAGTASPMTYTSIEREYDLRVRDANEATAAHEPLVIGFSAGNSGNAGLTRPKSAKNIITTGATDAYRPTVKSPYGPGAGNGCDGASALPSSNINMMVCFSSYGNAQDGRVKPDVVAPGGNIASARAGGDTLWGNIDTTHRWCSGTSQAAPHTAGMAALIVEKWRSENGGLNPSPAMVKAKLINSAVELKTSTAAPASSVYPVTTNLPNNREGWGRLDTKRHLAPTVQIMHRDQDAADTLGASAQIREFEWFADSASEPLYVTLVWTDAAAALNANPALVNDLDLEVILNGVTYKGNVLATTGTTGKVSLTGGTRDSINNVENVFIPTVAAGDSVKVRVLATAINGDGIPGNADLTDQDFALVVYNAKPCTPPAAPVVAASSGPSVGEITLAWGEVAGATAYRIYRSTDACPGGTFSLVHEVSGTGTTWTDSGLTAGSLYSYKVTAFALCESAPSTCVDEEAFSCVTPESPAELKLSTPATNVIQLDWTASVTASVTYNVYRADGSCAGTFALVESGITGTTWSDTSVTGGSTHAYQVTASVSTCESVPTTCASTTATGGPGVYSASRRAAGAPQNTSLGQTIRWKYNSGATLLAPLTISGAIFTGANDRLLHAMNLTAAGGNWPTSPAPRDWHPPAMNAPAQSRAPILDVTTYPIMGATRVTFVSSQDGRLYCFNANSGALLWSTGVLGDMLQASPGMIFRQYGSKLTGMDLLIVGTRNSSTANRLYAINAADGTTVWTYTHPDGIGPILAMPTPDVALQRIYFTSRAGGSANTVWALDYTQLGWSLRWAAAAGDAETTPWRRGTRIFVGNNTGQVMAFEVGSTGTASPSWTFSSNDGPVKSFVLADRSTAYVYFSTTNRVWSVAEGSAVEKWKSDGIANPSSPTMRGTELWVGASNGELVKLSGINPGPPAIIRITLGGGVVGSPSVDFQNNLIHAGTEAGIVYAVMP